MSSASVIHLHQLHQRDGPFLKGGQSGPLVSRSPLAERERYTSGVRGGSGSRCFCDYGLVSHGPSRACLFPPNLTGKCAVMPDARPTRRIRGGRFAHVGIRNKLSAGEIRMSVIAIVKSDSGRHWDRLNRDNSSFEEQ